MKYDCPDTLMCAINCASEKRINRTTSKVIPFNNYGKYSLRIRICDFTVHPQKLERYANVEPVPCKQLSDFKICTRWIPPLTFIPVAIPSNATYIEVDNCETLPDGSEFCHMTTEPLPVRVYGNERIFASQFNVAQSNVSICKTDGIGIILSTELQFKSALCNFSHRYLFGQLLQRSVSTPCLLSKDTDPCKSRLFYCYCSAYDSDIILHYTLLDN